MKHVISTLLILISVTAFAQRNKQAKMAPVYESGYYVSTRGDTTYGDIQVNPEDETSFYHEFAFKKEGSPRPRAFNTNRTKAYGFGDRHFVLVNHDGEKMFAERLASGRLAFYEYRFHGKIDGIPAIESNYFVRDTWNAENDNEKEKTVTLVKEKFYKKALKPFMKEEQPMIWTDLDKFTFDKNAVVRAISEFNSYYKKKAN